jgi:glycosyltransferase involved in cell wall biosynthesis
MTMRTALPSKISVLIPTKDEQGSIRAVIDDSRKALEGIDHEIVVVDASSDDTPLEAARAGAKVVKQIGAGGVGEALIQGFYWCRGEYIVFFDGDGTYVPAEIHKVIEPLLNDEADLVNGNRFFNMETGAMPFGNKLGNFMLTWLGNMLFHTSIKDSQSGMKAFRRDLLMRVTLWERGFPFCSELLAEASKLGMRITEVGITYKRRVGKTKLNPITVGPSIFWASFKMLRDYDPLFLFFEIGLILEAAGFIVAWPVIVEYIQFGTFRLLGRAMIGLFCWFAGLLSMFTGIILNGFNYSVKKIEARINKSQ